MRDQSKHLFRRSRVRGIILVVLGLVFLGRNFGVDIPFLQDGMEKLWPLILVALGLASLLRHRPEQDAPIA